MADDNDKKTPAKVVTDSTPDKSGVWYTGKDGKLIDKPPQKGTGTGKKAPG